MARIQAAIVTGIIHATPAYSSSNQLDDIVARLYIALSLPAIHCLPIQMWPHRTSLRNCVKRLGVAEVVIPSKYLWHAAHKYQVSSSLDTVHRP